MSNGTPGFSSPCSSPLPKTITLHHTKCKHTTTPSQNPRTMVNAPHRPRPLTHLETLLQERLELLCKLANVQASNAHKKLKTLILRVGCVVRQHHNPNMTTPQALHQVGTIFKQHYNPQEVANGIEACLNDPSLMVNHDVLKSLANTYAVIQREYCDARQAYMQSHDVLKTFYQ